MRFRFLLPRWLCSVAFVASLFAAVASARAQKQEGGTLARVNLDRPANTQSYEFAGASKSFGTSAAFGGKQARVKTFDFGSKTSVLGGDGAFHSKTFNPKAGGFHAEAYTTKSSQLSQRNSFAQGDKAFDTKPMDVREAPGANKSAAAREFIPRDKTYYGRGKRQDMLDERTQGAKNLTINEVRDLLNKGPAAKPGTILEPVLPSIR